MPTFAPPARTAISDTYPNPSNAVARVGFGALWDYCTSLLGLTGTPADARTALGLVIGTNVQAYDAATVKTNVTAAFTKPQSITTQALTTSVGIDASTYQSWVATVSGSTFTVANPTGGISGCFYALNVIYSTANTIAFGANFKGITNFIPTAAAGAIDNLIFRFDGTYYECVSIATNIKA